jgi:hypothetical protein
MANRPDRNREYVERSCVKSWLIKNARPSAIDELIESVEDGTGDQKDLRMLYDVRAHLVGPPRDDALHVATVLSLPPPADDSPDAEHGEGGDHG